MRSVEPSEIPWTNHRFVVGEVYSEAHQSPYTDCVIDKSSGVALNVDGATIQVPKNAVEETVQEIYFE